MGSHSHDDDSIDGEDFEDDVVNATRDEEEWDKGVAPFVKKLTNLVSENKDQVEWSKEGSFMVKDIDTFSSVLLPKYFKAIKLCSFIRQLNMYNFHKVEDAPNANPRSMEFRNEFFLPGRKDLLNKIKRRETTERSNGKSEENEDTKKKVAPEKRVGSSVESILQDIQGIQEESNYKCILQTMAKLQHQTEMNQLALKQVLDELSMYRKVNYDLEQKVSQLNAQVNGNSNMSIQNTNYLLQNMLIQLTNRNMTSSVPQSPPPAFIDLSNVQSNSPTPIRPNLLSSMGLPSPTPNYSYNIYNHPDVSYLTPQRGDNNVALQPSEEGKLNLDILQQPLHEVENQYEFNGFWYKTQTRFMKQFERNTHSCEINCR